MCERRERAEGERRGGGRVEGWRVRWKVGRRKEKMGERGLGGERSVLEEEEEEGRERRERRKEVEGGS